MRISRVILIFLVIPVLLFSCKRKTSQIGDDYYAAQQYEEAIEAYTAYLKLRPKSVKTIYNRGRAYEELGIRQKALADFEQVIVLDHENENAYLSLGMYYYEDESYNKASIYFDKAIKVNSNNAQGFYLKARVNHQMGLFPNALNEYNKALSLDNRLGEAYLYRGAVNIQLKRRKSACQDFQKAKELEVEEADQAIRKYCNR